MTATLGLLGAGTLASAATVTLEDRNSVAQFELDTEDGQFSWKVNDLETLNRQWFWFRLDGQTEESSLDELGPASNIVTSDVRTDDPGLDKLEVTHADSDLSIKVTYTLEGGGSGSLEARLSELIEITNTSSTTRTIDFFQLADFDLPLKSSPDEVEIYVGSQAVQTSSLASLTESASAGGVGPVPDLYEAGLGGEGPGSLFDRLQDASITNLQNISTYGPGDVAWSFQWQEELLPGETFQISKVKTFVQLSNPIPEPATALVMLIGGAGLLAGRRMKRR